MTDKIKDGTLTLIAAQKTYEESLLDVIYALSEKNAELREQVTKHERLIDTMSREFRRLNERFNEHVNKIEAHRASNMPMSMSTKES